MSKAMITFVETGDGGMTVQLGFDRPIEKTPEGLDAMTNFDKFVAITYTRIVAALEEQGTAPAENVTEH